jgi:hypothetical protein
MGELSRGNEIESEQVEFLRKAYEAGYERGFEEGRGYDPLWDAD